MPFMIVSPESGSVVMRKDGSSWTILFRATPSFSVPALSFGASAIEMTGSGNTIGSSVAGFFASASVWPVCVFFMPSSATMSPACAESSSSRELACISTMRPIRSVLPVKVFSTLSPFLIRPE